MSKAFIIGTKIVPDVQLHAMKLHEGKLYFKEGHCYLGDNKVEVLEGETAIEVFSDDAYAYAKRVFAESVFWTVREVEVRWNKE